MTITATFDDLEGDVPTAEGAGGQDPGSAKTIVKGKMIWTTRAHMAEGST